MKLRTVQIIGLCFSVLLSASCSSVAKATQVKVIIFNAVAREEPKPGKPVAFVVEKGDKEKDKILTVLGERTVQGKKWLKVRSETRGKTGWILRKQVRNFTEEQGSRKTESGSRSDPTREIDDPAHQNRGVITSVQPRFETDKDSGLPIRYRVIVHQADVHYPSKNIEQLQALDICYLIKDEGEWLHVGYEKKFELRDGYILSKHLQKCQDRRILIPSPNRFGSPRELTLKRFIPALGKTLGGVPLQNSELNQLLEERSNLTLPIFGEEGDDYKTFLHIRAKPPPPVKNRLMIYIAGNGQMLSELTVPEIEAQVTQLVGKFSVVNVKFHAINLSEEKPSTTKGYDAFNQFLAQNRQKWAENKTEKGREIFQRIPKIVPPPPAEEVEVELFSMVYLNNFRDIELEGIDDFVTHLKAKGFEFYPLTMQGGDRGYFSEPNLLSVAQETDGEVYHYNRIGGEPDLVEPFSNILRRLLVSVEDDVKRIQREQTPPPTISQVLLPKDNDWFEPAVLITKTRWEILTQELSVLARYAGVEVDLPQIRQTYLQRSRFFDDSIYAIPIREIQVLFAFAKP